MNVRFQGKVSVPNIVLRWHMKGVRRLRRLIRYADLTSNIPKQIGRLGRRVLGQYRGENGIRGHHRRTKRATLRLRRTRETQRALEFGMTVTPPPKSSWVAANKAKSMPLEDWPWYGDIQSKGSHVSCAEHPTNRNGLRTTWMPQTWHDPPILDSLFPQVWQMLQRKEVLP